MLLWHDLVRKCSCKTSILIASIVQLAPLCLYFIVSPVLVGILIGFSTGALTPVFTGFGFIGTQTCTFDVLSQRMMVLSISKITLVGAVLALADYIETLTIACLLILLICLQYQLFPKCFHKRHRLLVLRYKYIPLFFQNLHVPKVKIFPFIFKSPTYLLLRAGPIFEAFVWYIHIIYVIWMNLVGLNMNRIALLGSLAYGALIFLFVIISNFLHHKLCN